MLCRTIFDRIYCANSLFLELTNEQEIGEIILELKRDSVSGFDEISVKDLLNLKDILIPIITKLVNNILKSNIFPQELKISKISPIFKSGNRNCINDYRPISVTSVFSKILEKIIKKRMLSFINEFVLQDKFQYGFVKNSSTLSATVDFIDFVSKELDSKYIVVAVFVDLRKAFDVVSFEI